MLLKKRKVKQKLPVPDVNVVSLMDVLTTLLFFLLVIASVSRLYVIPSSSLISGTPTQSDKKPQFSLQVILYDKKTAYMYLGPIDQLRIQRSDEFRAYLKSRFKGSDQTGYYRKLEAVSTPTLLKDVQNVLKIIKQSFPLETKAVVAFTDAIPYQTLVDTLDTVRQIPQTEASIQVKPPVGSTQVTQVLFPQVIVTEWAPETKEGA